MKKEESPGKKPAGFDEYLEIMPEAAVPYLKELREIIRETLPGVKELINYGIPAFSLTENGKRDQQIMIAGYKNHVGLYPHPAVMEKFESELSQYKRGKGSVQFRIDEPLPREIITRMLEYRRELLERGA